MYTRRTIYVASIFNDEPALVKTDVQVLPDKQKRARSSSVMITLSQRHPSALTSLEEQRALFDQCRNLLEPAIHHHEALSTKTPDKPSIFYRP